MQTAVSALASRTKLLDPSQLDQVESRLAIVQQRLTQIAEKKEVLEQSGKLNKVTLNSVINSRTLCVALNSSDDVNLSAKICLK